MKATDYYLYRYFIINNRQISIMDVNREEIERRFLNIFNDKKIKHPINSNYTLYSIDNYQDELLICKLSKKSTITVHREGEKDINIEEERDYPFVYVIISIINQIIIIQKNTSVFPDTYISKKFYLIS